jgi:hypothetical protein
MASELRRRYARRNDGAEGNSLPDVVCSFARDPLDAKVSTKVTCKSCTARAGKAKRMLLPRRAGERNSRPRERIARKMHPEEQIWPTG